MTNNNKKIEKKDFWEKLLKPDYVEGDEMIFETSDSKARVRFIINGFMFGVAILVLIIGVIFLNL
jgi:hypothetical protein